MWKRTFQSMVLPIVKTTSRASVSQLVGHWTNRALTVLPTIPQQFMIVLCINTEGRLDDT